MKQPLHDAPMWWPGLKDDKVCALSNELSPDSIILCVYQADMRM